MAFKRVVPDKPVKDLTPLDVTCTSTRCADQFHCFKASNETLEKYGKVGVCRDCGADPVDWDRIRRQDPKDTGYTTDMLKMELLRYLYWDLPLSGETRAYTVHRGKEKVKERAAKILRQKIGKAQNFREGYQTPKKGKEIIHFAQHATATCCRACLAYWHNIPPGTDLTEEQIEYCTIWIMRFVEEKMPDLLEPGDSKQKKL
jgi:hypothetical protein